jgi:hypothetical protein
MNEVGSKWLEGKIGAMSEFSKIEKKAETEAHYSERSSARSRIPGPRDES